MGEPYWQLLQELPRSCCVSSERVEAGCAVPVFSTVWLVMRRLTVGVEEASGAVCVGEIHQFCGKITCVRLK